MPSWKFLEKSWSVVETTMRSLGMLSYPSCQDARHTDRLSLLLARTTVMEMMVSDGTANLANLRTAVPSAPCQDSAAAGEFLRKTRS